ncbi:hypothetical protein [Saccharothrix syringae]|uniref:hypothetical protein n=1 Tax=Saccharothrix syringae TaxID=103733 RepID=UPI003D1581F4
MVVDVVVVVEVVLDVVVVVVVPPVHTTPFRAKLAGLGLLPVQEPLNPNDTVAPVAIDPL